MDSRGDDGGWMCRKTVECERWLKDTGTNSSGCTSLQTFDCILFTCGSRGVNNVHGQ